MKRLRTTLLTLLFCLSIQCRPVQEEKPKPRFDQIGAVIAEEIEKGNFPGAVVLVGHRDGIVYWKAFGHEMTDPCEESMSKNTVFDMASVTKPVATATSILILMDRHAIGLDDYVGAYLPAFACKGKEEVRIKHLLAHTSGLAAYTNASKLEEQFGSPCPEEVIAKICSLEGLSTPGEKFLYSCLNYITLCKIVEVVSGERLDVFSRENIFAPLGMKHTTFNPPASWEKDIAATEVIDGKPLRGTVHDPLARLMGGISGNAGLFSNAHDLSIYCRMLLNGGIWKRKRILSPEAVRLLTTAQTHGRAYGFGVSSRYASAKGAYASENAFTHTGYTGTSTVCDPESETYVIILANRVHPKDDGSAKPVRTQVADIVFSQFTTNTNPKTEVTHETP
jgi:CubicO group peptidase (beta-lactamase class C family)